MIVGAGAGQVPIIEHCKRHGLYTIVISPFGPYPGIKIADKHINEDIYNMETLVDIGREENIDYVISDQSDYAVPIVAYIAEKLHLPGNNYNTACIYTYKSKFREFADKYNIPAPKSIVIDSNHYDINGLKFPLVIKPADSQGSRGISKIMHADELPNAVDEARKYSKHNKVVVEEYFKGTEIVCEGFVLNGEYYNIAFGDRCYFNLKDLFIPSKTIFPSSIDANIREKIILNEKSITSKLNPNFGIVHSEYLVNENGEFVVIESALRGGGVYIASHLIPFSTGIDLTEVLVEAMMGNIDYCEEMISKQRNGKFAEYLCFYLNEGEVTDISGMEAIKQLENIVLAELGNLGVGDSIGKFEHKGMRKGPFIIVDDTLDAVRNTELNIRKALNIQINNTQGIVWD